MAETGVPSNGVHAAEEQAAKRARTDGPGPSSSGAGAAAAAEQPAPPALVAADQAVRASLFDPASRTELRARHDSSGPYTHLVLRDLFDPALLRAVREEVIHNVQATYKETDLFKVFQTGDLANLDALDEAAAAQLPALRVLRDALYSERFKGFIRDITGCGELSSAADLSCNVYAQGGHLLCHDDVIGSRRVSFIVYLTDPDDPWTAEEGGALELYPLAPGEAAAPAVEPTEALVPYWNSMALFTVQPGRSFHSVQEVVGGDKPRLSISGWFHAPAAPEGAEQASLAQLQLEPGEDAATGHTLFDGGLGAMSGPLSDADRAHLGAWVSAAYLDPAAWGKIQTKFEGDGSIQLQGFLRPEVAQRITAATRAGDAADGLAAPRMPPHTAGYGAGWQPVGPPHKQRYMRFDGAPAELAPEGAASAGAAAAASGAAAPGGGASGSGRRQQASGPAPAALLEGAGAGALLAALRAQLFGSAAFGRLLRCFTTIAMLGHTGEVRRLRPGLDYTVAHYGVLTRDPRLDCVLTFVDDASSEQAAAWDSGEVGGFEAYLLADEEEASAAAVYRARDDDGGVINVPPAANSLNLLLRDTGLMRFVKYVSAAAPGSRWDVAMEYLPEDDGEEGEGEEGQGPQPGEGQQPEAAVGNQQG